jgi:very-short-patch-repair endonuclease
MRAPRRTSEFAKSLRRQMSLPEVLLWRELKRSAGTGPQFRKQHPFGPYVLDFYCSRARLCIEVDGCSHGTGDRAERDAGRDRYLESACVRVERIAASVVLQDPHAVATWAQHLAAELIAASAARPLSQLR